MENLFETLFGLGWDGETDEQGSPKHLQGAVMLKEYEDDMASHAPPLYVQKALLAVVAPLERALGYRVRYPLYSDPG